MDPVDPASAQGIVSEIGEVALAASGDWIERVGGLQCGC
jgi:hypothetical protein